MQNNLFLKNSHINQTNHGQRALWRAVILQAFMDSLTKSKRTEEQLARASARGWLLGMSQDFKNVCNMAGYEPNMIKRRAQKFMNKGMQVADIIKKSKKTK